MSRYPRLALSAAVTILALLWLWSRWQPARQARVHTENLVSVVGKRDWGGLKRLLADDYADSWGNDKTVVMERVNEVFSQFFTVELKIGASDITATGARASVRAPVTLKGRGGPLAEMAVQRVSALREPFVFTWRRESWRPWDWALIRVEQPELKVESW